MGTMVKSLCLIAAYFRSLDFNPIFFLSIPSKWLGVCSVLFLVIGCTSDSDDNDQSNQTTGALDDPLRSHISSLALTGDPSAGRSLPAINEAKAQLGKKLFFSKGLGGDTDAACVTCHHPMLGGGDNLSLAIGVGAESPDLLGPGRIHAHNAEHNDGGPTVPRNSPSTFNIALWDQALFLDGRVESLGKTALANGSDGQGIRTPDSDFDTADSNAGENLVVAQARFPVTSPEEMRGFSFQAGGSNDDVRTALASRLTGFGGWDAEFSAAFGDTDITFDRIVDAIATYESSQVFVNTPWKAYIEGDDAAISDSAKRGAMFFFDSIEDGGANCASCHTGDFFTDEQFYVLATPQIGRGKGNDNGVNGNDDFGRSRETGDASDKYKFRTPTLLNVEVTGPWGHAGAYTTLDAVVRHMLNPEDAVNNYDFSQLEPNVQASDMRVNTGFALDQLADNRNNNVENVHQNVVYTEENVMDLVEFLKSLTDPCVKDRNCLADWIPDANDTNPDGLRLNAINSSGDYL